MEENNSSENIFFLSYSISSVDTLSGKIDFNITYAGLSTNDFFKSVIASDQHTTLHCCLWTLLKLRTTS